VQTLVAQRLIGRLEARLRARDRLQIERMQRFNPLAKQLAENEDGLALLAMLLDDTYHDWMHEPPELPPAVSEPPPRTPRRGKRKSGYKRGRKKGG
jgi:ATP-dependent RNA helicase DeaD